ncbi:hypothetical protein C7B80_10185 [Cyanosarcina cf. burmensis CCALA 770]|nr:hypothetical protein C7B80_10185 [Cyanosarcina cf. burmensis CCALA 770]
MDQLQQREQLLISYAFKHACQELERITGTLSDDWETEMLNRAQNWIDADERVLDELSEEVIEEEAAA